ncbi:MAG: ABC transporter ATP-binding protein [Limisphaerales bacterium]
MSNPNSIDLAPVEPSIAPVVNCLLSTVNSPALSMFSHQGRSLVFFRNGRPAMFRRMEIAPPVIAQAAAPALIEVEGLTKLYGDFPAVTDLSFAVRPGEVIGLVGPNGAGKTTTLRCLAGIIPATRGSVRICGRDLATQPIEAKRRLAFFSDEPRLFDYLTVDQHLNFTARIYGVANYREIARPLMEELEMADKTDKLPGELSRGMKQKLAIACGLLHSPEVIFFDEPLTGLDPIGIRRMKDSILKRGRAGAAILISSHLLHLLEEVCSHVLILKNGRKIVDGSLGEVRQKFSEQSGDTSFEEVFFRATGETKDAP